ncbi:MAG: hypothetical protein IPJ81_18025 [Chitinophagaceae bacterium]|nr:hypothetical protein [Chitinophagaceae bacterium]
MSTLQQIKKRFLSLQGQEIEIAKQAFDECSQAAEDLIAGQLAQGIKSSGEKAEFSYSPLTIAIKKTKSGLSAVTSHLTNYDTGESYAGLYAKVNGSMIEFGTTSSKEEDISDRMDGQAFKLTQESKEEFIRQHVQKAFTKKVREHIKL